MPAPPLPMNGLSDWFHTPLGRYALAWEQAQREGGGVGLMRIHLADWMGKLTSAKLEEGRQVELG